jgi:hypothetical protein
MTSTGLWLTADVVGVLRGLAVGAAAMPPSEFRDGYATALMALGAPLERDDRARAPEPVSTSRVFDDLSHESVPFPFAAFARMGA